MKIELFDCYVNSIITNAPLNLAVNSITFWGDYDDLNTAIDI